MSENRIESSLTPIEHDTTAVVIRGEDLGTILWRGRQWAVTDRGLEKLDGTHFLPKNALADDLSEWSMIRHMGEKTEWLDLEDFVTAFMVAIVLWGHAPGFPAEVILRDYHKAKQETL